MRPYIYLDHTSEAKFRAFGHTMEEAWKNAALALFSLVIDPKDVRPVVTRTIKVAGKSPLQLLFNFFDELVFVQDDGFLLHEVTELSLQHHTLNATLLGDSHAKYETSGEVKAPTYHDMSIELDESTHIFSITAVVDI